MEEFLSFFHGPKAPSGRGPHHRGLAITQSVELLWTSDQSDAETSTRQTTTLTLSERPKTRDLNSETNGDRPLKGIEINHSGDSC